jgi:hypothetical protein
MVYLRVGVRSAEIEFNFGGVEKPKYFDGATR